MCPALGVGCIVGGVPRGWARDGLGERTVGVEQLVDGLVLARGKESVWEESL